MASPSNRSSQLWIAIVAIAAVAMWLTWRGAEGAEGLARDSTTATIPPSESEETVAPPTPAEPVALREDVEASAPAQGAEIEEPAEPAPIDRSERATLRIRVTDRFDTPVSQASVVATGLRTTYQPGTWHGWTGTPPRAETDTEGIAELDYPVWEDSTGGEWSDVAKVCFTVEHPSYATADIEGPVSQQEIHVVLELGAVLVVSGWIDDPAERIDDVRAILNYEVDVDESDWVPLRDGRLSCNRIPPGEHVIALRHERDGVPYTSLGTEFELAESEQKELHLELLAPRTVRGSFDAVVPRPVEHGAVRAAVVGGARGRAVIQQTVSADVAADGTFELRDLPPGDTEIIGLCDGWSSTRFPSPQDDMARVCQVIPGDLEGEFVLHMEPTSRVVLTVLDPAGAPLPGAIVYTWPNVHWKSGFGQIFIDPDDPSEYSRRKWWLGTDEDGVVVLENLPPKPRESLTVKHRNYVMPMSPTPWGIGERRSLWFDLEPGGTVELRVQLEEGEK